MKFSILLTCILFRNFTLFIRVNSGNPDTIFTDDEKTAVESFREMIRNIAYRNFQLEDYYIIHFLRANRLNLERTRAMFEKQYRIAKSIDSIIDDVELKEYMTTRYPVSIDGIDRTGSPVLTVSVGKWDVRQAALSGNIPRMTQYIDFVYESVTTKIRNYRNNGTNDVTQYVHIYDLNNYTLKQHGCLGCIAFYRNVVQHYEFYYPDNAKSIIIINTPGTFRAMLELLRPLMSPATQKCLKSYHYNKAEWSKALQELISPDQLTPQFGGTKEMRYN